MVFTMAQGNGGDVGDGSGTNKRASYSSSDAADRAQQILDIAGVMIMVLDPSGRVQEINRKGCELLRGERGQILGKDWFETFLLPSDRQELRYHFAEIISGKTEAPEGHQSYIRTLTGATRRISWHNAILRDEDGAIAGMLSSGEDITERARAQAALRESEEKFRNIVESSPIGMHMYVLVPDGRLVFMGANPAADKILGVDHGQFIGQTLEEAFPPLAATEVPAQYRRCAEHGGHWHTDNIQYEDDEIVGAFRVDAFQTSPGRMVATFLDITDAKRAEERDKRHARALELLAESAMGFVRFPIDGDLYGYIAEKLVELIGDGVVGVLSFEEGENRFSLRAVRGSRPLLEAATRIMGHEIEGMSFQVSEETLRDRFAGKLSRLTVGLDELSPEAFGYEEVLELNAALEFGDLYDIGTVRGGRLLGSVGIMTTRGAPPLDSSLIEAFVGQASVALDRKRTEEEKAELEERLLQSQKMEAIGTLAGGVAHDFNNLLTGIIGQAWVLKRKLEHETPSYRGVEAIETAALRATELTKQLLGFARKGKVRNTSVPMHRVIDDTISVLRHTLDKRILVESHADEAHPPVKGDPTQLQQVMLNLAVNARDAMPDGGKLVFATRPVDWEVDLPGKYLEVSVADTGSGIPEEIKSRVFEPFFTTKPQGQGTGMGLAMVYGIVQNHGGWLELESVSDAGTTFRLYLPLADQDAAPAIRSVKEVPARGEGRILVVDDEDAVRTVLEQILVPIGYQVACAANGKEAVKLYAARPESFDLVMLDMVMPVMNGTSCFRALKAIDPKVRALLITGQGLDEVAQQLLDDGVLGFVAKPFVPEHLARKVRELLAIPRTELGGDKPS